MAITYLSHSGAEVVAQVKAMGRQGLAIRLDATDTLSQLQCAWSVEVVGVFPYLKIQQAVQWAG